MATNPSISDILGPVSNTEVVFLLFDGVKQLDVSGPAEVFAEAARFGGNYRMSYVSVDGSPVKTSVGLTVLVDGAASDAPRPDLLVLPGGDRLTNQAIESELLSAVRNLVPASRRVASICTGAFLLATTGELAGRKATTHWEHAALLARTYREVNVVPDAIFASDGKFLTSAGVSAGIDLALAVVEADHGADVARDVAQHLVVYMRRPSGQSQFSSMLGLPTSTRHGVRQVAEAVAAAPEGPYTLEILATMAGISGRHLTRLFQADLGYTPLKYVEHVRLELAKTFLLSGESVAGAARRSGFESVETMRRAFTNKFEASPTEFRRRFMSTASAGAGTS